jgi:ethanolamine utilization microcompartment shell protein EutS
MKKKSFFLIGMTSVLLAFGMTGCPNSTTSSGSTTPPPSGYAPPAGSTPQPHPFTAANPDALDSLLETVDNGEIYVVGNYTANGDVTLEDGQTLVIADQGFANSQPWPNASVGQLNLGTVNAVSTLTIKSGKTLTVQDEARLIVGNPETPSQNNGVLKILGGGGLTVEGGGHLGVTTASRVLVEKPASGTEGGLDLQTGANVFGLGTLGSLKLIGNATTSSVAGDTLIAIEKTTSGVSAPAVVAPGANLFAAEGIDENWVPYVVDDDDVQIAIEAQVTAINNASPVKEADSADDIAGLFNGGDGVAPAEKVTYTSENAIGEVSIPPGKTLVIAGAIADQDAAITVGAGGTLKVEGSLTTSGDLTVAEGGTLKVDGSLTTEGDLTIDSNATLEIAPGAEVTVSGEDGTLTAEEDAVIEIAEGATLTVANDGTLDLNALFTPDEE